MTVQVGVRGRAGVVLASDSQRTEGGFRETVQKLYCTGNGIIWGTAGSIAVQQMLWDAVKDVQIAGYVETRAKIIRVFTETKAQIEDTSEAFKTEGLFAWYHPTDGFHLLRVPSNEHGAEFATRFQAIGIRDAALFSLSSSSYLEYENLPVESLKMIAFKATDDVIRAAAQGVGQPIQLAAVTTAGAVVMTPEDVRGVEDTLAAFREHQRDFLVRVEPPTTEQDTGLRPK
jgi:20S proteasome alpha/beta subunit